MTVHRNDDHAKVVSTWESKNCEGLSSENLVRLYAAAFQAIERRSLITLSGVTVKVVVDRALHESREKFPLLSSVVVEPDRLNLSLLIDQSQWESHPPAGLKEALRYLLVELLNVLGNITADVLTAPLHKELMGVTADVLKSSSEPQSLRAVSPLKSTRRDS